MPSPGVWAGIGSALTVIVGLISTALGHETITLWINKIQSFFSPYSQITIPEYGVRCIEHSDFYAAIEAYLYQKCGTGVRKLTAELGSHEEEPHFCIDDGQQISDTYDPRDANGSSNSGSGGGRDGDRGAKATVWWHAYKSRVLRQGREVDLRFFRVSFHRRFYDLIQKKYLPHVIKQGREAIAEKRQQRLFTNNPDGHWISAALQHPATFDTLAMDPTRRKEIMADLNAFRDGKEYYKRVGKPWKRGYLLYGPPGTGKSTMVSVMAKHLKYDVYDLELTAVKSNKDLRRLFINTTGKSIIVVEDIDRSGVLSGGRRGEKNKQLTMIEEEDPEYGLTLSGLLNFVDGLWSACGGERIIIFTTNDMAKLEQDGALIRRGRMDMHIEMSYCSYEGFKVLAKNYLGNIDESGLFEQQFGAIQNLLEKANMTPAEVAEQLMMRKLPSNMTPAEVAAASLEGLIQILNKKVGASKEEGERQQRLFTNNPDGYWISAAFRHPATFDTLAMDPTRKREVMDDLDVFRKGKEYYERVGKPWKRGYLLYGPPGTGKSTMVSVMANHLKYDVYDLELTAVKSNNDLRRLFIKTTGKSIIVVEDIDRSGVLTGGRRGEKNKQSTMTEEEDAENGLTLSGLLNFVDGLWSACAGERIIVFTTSDMAKLDLALIPTGRMDVHIEMSYCSYEGFKVLAKNYLGNIDERGLFEQYGAIQNLLENANMTPAEVAKQLMMRKPAAASLEGLIQTLNKKVGASKEEGERDQG